MNRLRILLTSQLTLVVCVATGHAQNVIPDPSFENADGWTLGDNASSIDKGVARTGSNSLKLNNDGSKTTNHNAGQYSIDGVQPNTEYVYSVWVKGNAVTGSGPGGKPLAVVRWRDGSNKKITDEMYMWAPYGSYSWQKMSIYLQSPPKAAKVDISFRSWWVVAIDEGCLSGSTNWDDASLVPRDLSHRGKLAGSYQAAAASRTGGVIETKEPDYSGGSYFHPTSSGAFLSWSKVAGGAGGSRILSFRYAWEGNAQAFEVFVNGTSQGVIKPTATGSTASWASFESPATLKPGDNTVKIVVSKVTAGPNIDRLDVYYEAGTIPPPPPDAGVAPDQFVPKDSALQPDQKVSPAPDAAASPDAASPPGPPDASVPDVSPEDPTPGIDGGDSVDADQPCIGCVEGVGSQNAADSRLDGGCAVGSRPDVLCLWVLALGAALRRSYRFTQPR